jgi:hypothetical protein
MRLTYLYREIGPYAEDQHVAFVPRERLKPHLPSDSTEWHGDSCRVMPRGNDGEQ